MNQKCIRNVTYTISMLLILPYTLHVQNTQKYVHLKRFSIMKYQYERMQQKPIRSEKVRMRECCELQMLYPVSKINMESNFEKQ